MKQYDSYKDSGVEWIGKVPSHWEIIRSRYLCNLCTGNKDTINRVDDGKYPFYVRSPKVERINTYSFDGEAILMAGDGVGAGKVFHYANGKFDYHQRVYNFHDFKRITGKFFYYYIANNFRYIIEEGGAKNTVDSVRLYMIQNFLMTVPPKEEQRDIVSYLDKKCSEIDNVISAQQRRIALLQELKQSVITHAITKGLNPNVEMKDSGVDWIGKIPANWNIVRLKNDCSLKGRIGWNGLRSEEFEEKSYAYLVTGQDFVSSDIDWSKCYQINKERYDEDPCIQLENGDLLITKDGTIGKIAKVSNMDKPACLNSGIFVLKQNSRNEFIQGYLYWSLYSNLLKNFNSYTSTGTTILHLYQNVFENMPLVVPSKNEQQDISDYLDEKVKVIDNSISKAQYQVELLQEYKQSLITEVVTGKRKVC